MGTFESHPIANLPVAENPESLRKWRETFDRYVKSEKDNELVFYKLVIVRVREVLLGNIPLAKLTKDYVGKVLIPVITILIARMNEYQGSDKSVESVIRNLRAARVSLNDALELFDNKKDPGLIHGKNKALSDTEEELTKAIKYLHHIKE